MELVTFWTTLMEYAYEVGQARKSGDKKRLAEAEKKLEEYKAVCLMADRMIIP